MYQWMQEWESVDVAAIVASLPLPSPAPQPADPNPGILPSPLPPQTAQLPLPPPPPFEHLDGPVRMFNTGGGWLIMNHPELWLMMALGNERERLRRVRLGMQPYGYVLECNLG